MDGSVLFLLAWSALCFWVLGQIWFAQIVVYPLFAHVDEASYIGYHSFYSRRIPPVVIVPGFASFVLPFALPFVGPAVPAWMSTTLVVSGVAGFLVTVLLAIPRHDRLQTSGKDAATIEGLVRHNWLRTASVTVQAAVTLAMLAHVFAAARP